MACTNKSAPDLISTNVPTLRTHWTLLGLKHKFAQHKATKTFAVTNTNNLPMHKTSQIFART